MKLERAGYGDLDIVIFQNNEESTPQVRVTMGKTVRQYSLETFFIIFLKTASALGKFDPQRINHGAIPITHHAKS